MIKTRATGFSVLTLLLVLPLTGTSGGLLDELRARQKEVKTVRADFFQEKKTALLQRPVKSSGVFHFKSPVGVRWQYEDGILVIYDGNALYMYNPEMEEAEKIKGASAFIGPLSFDIKHLVKDYDIKTEKAGDNIHLLLRPKERMPFQSVEIIFPGGMAFPEEVRVKEETGDSTVIKFLNIKINGSLSDELFVFTPPPGVKVRERTLLK